MNARPVTDEDLLLYACGELEDARKAEVEAALGRDPAKAARAMAMLSAFRLATRQRSQDTGAGDLSEDFAGRLKNRLLGELQASDPIPFSEEVVAEWYRRREAEKSELLDESDEQVLLWACDQLSPEEQHKVEARLAKDPRGAAEALALRDTLHMLQAGRPELPAGFSERLRERLGRELREREDLATAQPWHEASATAGTISEQDSALVAEEGPAWDRVRIRPALRSIRRASVALAACLCVCGLVWIMLFGRASTSAYALADMPRRMQQLRSLYLKGWVYRQVGDDEKTAMARHPLEWHVQRPDRYYRREGDGYAQCMAGDGVQYMLLRRGSTECLVGAEYPLVARRRVESLLQSDLIGQLAGDLSQEYTKLRTETLDGARTDVYEQVQVDGNSRTSRILVWFNPETGLPVKSQRYLQSGSDPEYLYAEFDEIHPDHPARQDMFAFQPPEGYTVVRRDREADSVGMASISRDGKHAIIRFIFNIGDQALLLCWAYYDDSGTRIIEPGLREPDGSEMSVRPKSWTTPWPHRRHLLRVDAGKEYHWRWMLMVPSGKEAVLDRGGYSFTFNAEKAGIRATVPLLRFEREDLENWLAEAQALTLPDDAPAGSAFTLEQLEDLIAR